MIRAREANLSRLLLVLLLLLTSASVLGWGHFRHLDQDEWFVFQTDTVPSSAQVLDIQLHHPISLDPGFYHLLGHASVSLFGHNAFAIRLPSLFGFLLMQVCLFAFTRRIAGGYAGVVAAAIPAITWPLFYAQQARPYGLLLGLGALLLLAYQHATRDYRRAVWLFVLALTLALALNSHYFAILLLLPLYAAELARILQLRRIDWPMILAIGIGSAGALLTLPFQKGAGEFRKHYYNAGKVNLHAITQSYRALIVDYTHDSLRTQHILMALLVLGMIALLAAATIRLLKEDPEVPFAERIFLLVLALLPFFGFLLARFVTHSIEVRYILPATLGLSVFIAIATLPLYRRSFVPVGLVVFALVIAVGTEHMLHASRQIGAPLTLAAAQGVSGPVYIQNMGNFDELGNYVKDPAQRSRIALVYSSPLEIALAHHDTQSLTAEHMKHFTAYRIESYEELRNQPGPHLFILYPHDGWNWLDRALIQDGANITPLGPALHGQLVSVEFPQK